MLQVARKSSLVESADDGDKKRENSILLHKELLKLRTFLTIILICFI